MLDVNQDNMESLWVGSMDYNPPTTVMLDGNATTQAAAAQPSKNKPGVHILTIHSHLTRYLFALKQEER